MNADAPSKTRPRDSVLARFMLGFDGHSLPAPLADLLAQGLAGVVIYGRNFASVERLRELTAEIRKAAGSPVLIGIDQEGGSRFALKEPFTAWPSAAELGSLDDPAAVEQMAQAMARELRAAGCNLNFAPMLDLHVNPESPVTKDRSFGGDAGVVAKMGVAFHRGLKSGGVLSCAKHFPGHGDAVVDPHADLPVYLGAMETLEITALVPFAAAARAHVPLVMTAHILLSRIDAENPASLSRVIVNDLLRHRVGFEGVILADDLGMGAIAKRYGTAEASVNTFHAGTDIAMLCHDWSGVAPAIAAVRAARDQGRFSEKEWSAALNRIEAVIAASEAIETQPPLTVVGCDAHRALADAIRYRVP